MGHPSEGVRLSVALLVVGAFGILTLRSGQAAVPKTKGAVGPNEFKIKREEI